MDATNVQFSTVFCDDIRQETTGKLILIGAYQDNLTVKLPTEVFLAIWVRFQDLAAGDNKLEFEIRHNGERAAQGGGEIGSSEDLNIGGFVLPRFGLHIKEPGLLEFFVSLDGGDERLVGKLPIINHIETDKVST